MKVRLQTQSLSAPLYTGALDCLVKTLKWEGIGGLYKGMGSPLVASMFFRSVFFTTYHQSVSIMQKGDWNTSLTLPQYLLCGAITGITISFIEGPIDLFKTKMQIQIIKSGRNSPGQYRHVFHAGWSICKTYGVRGMYQGLGATIVRNMPSNALFFASWDTAKNHFSRKNRPGAKLSFPQLFISGAIAGICYWSFTYPIDVIKSSMQSDNSDKAKRQYRNIFDCAQKLYKQGGWKRFYKGYTPCLVRAVPAVAVTFITLEKCRQLFP